MQCVWANKGRTKPMTNKDAKEGRTTGYPMYFSRQGNPLHWDEWAKDFTEDNRMVKRTYLTFVSPTKTSRFDVTGTFPRGPETFDYCVSTVWLGLNHARSGCDPLIFETMIYNNKNQFLDFQTRYSTEEQAMAGHEAAIQMFFNKEMP